MMDQASTDLVKVVVDKLQPRYRALLANRRNAPHAFSIAYAEAVAEVAKARKMSVEKTRFFSRDVLQAIMNQVMG